MAFAKNDPNINRNGRPEGSVSIVSAIKRKLNENFPVKAGEEKRKYVDAIADVIVKKGMGGDVSMLKDITNRTDGMPIQKTDITTDGKPIYLPSEVILKNDKQDES